MDIKTFLYQVELLFIEDKNSSQQYIIERLNDQKRKLTCLINDLDSDIDIYLSVQRHVLINNVHHLYNDLITSVETFFEGRFEDSSNIIFERFLDPENKKRITPLKALHINSIDTLFRVRSNDTYSLYEKNEMFHIPFEKRGLVTNQRYSISGYPCLYLGTSVYGCWEATSRPHIDTFNVVSLKANTDLYFIDLRIPSLKNEEIKHLFNEEYIYQLILPLACSLKVKNPKDSFKPEYIIPQNILNSIIKRNFKKYTTDVNWDGIIYTANIFGRKECLFKDKDKLANIVMPIKTSDEKGLCKELVNQFTMTETTSILSERLTKNVKDTLIYSEKVFVLGDYKNTMWGEIEESILRKDYSAIE